MTRIQITSRSIQQFLLKQKYSKKNEKLYLDQHQTLKLLHAKLPIHHRPQNQPKNTFKLKQQIPNHSKHKRSNLYQNSTIQKPKNSKPKLTPFSAFTLFIYSTLDHLWKIFWWGYVGGSGLHFIKNNLVAHSRRAKHTMAAKQSNPDTHISHRVKLNGDQRTQTKKRGGLTMLGKSKIHPSSLFRFSSELVLYLKFFFPKYQRVHQQRHAWINCCHAKW